MIHASTKPLILNPTPSPEEAVPDPAQVERPRYSAVPPGVREQRLRQLDREWDVERLTAATAGLLLLFGLQLVSLRGEQWLVFPAVVAACLLLHALAGWTPALPLLRGLGFRTPQGIARERHALEASRSDVQTASPATIVQDHEDLARFEQEADRPASKSAHNDECGATRL